MEELNLWFKGIGNLGFPIALTIYLLVRFEKRIETLKNSIDQLINAIQEIGK